MSRGDVAHQMALSQSKINSEGQVLCQIGVHLMYLMVSDLTSSTAAHGQNLINFNSKELRAWQKGAAENLVKFCKDQDEATHTKEMKDQITAIGLQDYALVINCSENEVVANLLHLLARH
ncbi:hypothetical protein BS47DRAFT_1368904 [Hydnum rufescens UP504]|uniref:Uncharacterized protein n=1 Tax=Hydnum rufescens UP504 TaxID=1448309 RepID=A0A9P6DI59_9AGAM|nr:hypothetical protein BS47DRAFT_1368904 [Hydnum rufescens UP504]